MSGARGSPVSRADLQALAPALVPFEGAIYAEAARAPGPRDGTSEARYGASLAAVLVWLDVSALPLRAQTRLAAPDGWADGWVMERADAARSQLKNRAAALRSLEIRVKQALEAEAGEG